jgi:hypothetical protein
MLARNLYNNGVPKFLSIVQDPNLAISWSQYGEDTLIIDWLSSVKNKSDLFSNYYVDIGAYHPSLFSNTKLLSLMGWKGINVDPNPQSVQLFQQQRPQDINLNLGISDRESTAELYCFRVGTFNTFSEEVANKLIEQGLQVIAKPEIKLLSLNRLLGTYLPAEIEPSKIGFMNIDCEGLDTEIILNLDIHRYRPYIIAVEAHDFNLVRALDHAIVRFLHDAGYQLGAYTGFTLLFKRLKQFPD